MASLCRLPVTVVGFSEGNIVTQVKTEATDGYNAVQIGYRRRVRETKLTKPEMKHLKKSDVIPLRHLQEFRLLELKLMGLSPIRGWLWSSCLRKGIWLMFLVPLLGKGCKCHREPGSIGAGTTPGRVFPGKKMPGRMGGTKRKIRKLRIVKIDPELRIVMIKGAVPGKPGNLLRIAPAKIVRKNIPKN